MSLTSHLNTATSPVRDLVHRSSPLLAAAAGVTRSARAAKLELGILDVSERRLLVRRAADTNAATSGTAFDFRARMALAPFDPRRSAAADGVTTLSLYGWGYLHAARVAKQALRVATKMLASPMCTDDDRIAVSVVLAYLEAIYRSGPVSLSGSLGQRFDDARSGKALIRSVPLATVLDVKAIYEAATPQLRSWHSAMREGVRYLANPTFAGSRAVGGADADWLIGHQLIELKTTASLQPATVRKALLQCLGYVLLDWTDALAIREVAVWLPRYGLLQSWSLEQLLGGDLRKRLPALRGEMKAICGNLVRR